MRAAATASASYVTALLILACRPRRKGFAIQGTTLCCLSIHNKSGEDNGCTEGVVVLPPLSDTITEDRRQLPCTLTFAGPKHLQDRLTIKVGLFPLMQLFPLPS